MTAEIDVLELATELTIAWLSNPNTRTSAGDVPSFLTSMHRAVKSLTEPPPEPAATLTEEYAPAVTVRRSLASKDHIISMIDGKPYRMLRRHLSSNGLTPEQYRTRYNLKSDYPMVAESYSETRRSLAKVRGLGRKPAKTKEENAAPAAAKIRRTLKPSFQSARQPETAD